MTETPLYRRRIRIQSRDDSPSSYAVTITDTLTGETIPGVSRVIVYLDVNKAVNEAEVTYYETSPTGGVIVGQSGDPVQHIVSVENLEVDVVAYEQISNNEA